MVTDGIIPQPERVPKEEPDVCPATPFGPGKEWPEGIDYLGHTGTAGPYYPYDPEDPRAPKREKRAPGFVTEDDYVKGGVVKQYKRKRKR